MFKKLYGYFNNPLRKFGLKKKDQRTDYVYSTLSYGDTNEMLKEAKRLNRAAKKLGDRKYFVWPVGGLLDNSILVVGKRYRPVKF